MAQQDQTEIEEAAGRELGRMGVVGTLVFAGNSIELRTGGSAAPVSIDIELILGQWPLLPPEMRQRKAEEIARRLVSASRIARQVEGHAPTEVGAGARRRITGAVGGFLALLALIGAARWLVPRMRPPEPPAPTVPSESDTARTERLARACDAQRDRIYKGSGIGPIALEGFVVELWMAAKGGVPLRERPAVKALFAGKKLAAEADERLAQVADGTLDLAPGFEGEAAGRAGGIHGVTVVFGGGYARSFFEEEGRPRFLGLADRTAAASGAAFGALYARCAHLKVHDVGVWFRGPDISGATAAIVYQMGLFSEARMLDPGALAAARGTGSAAGGDLLALHRAAAEVELSIPPILGNAGASVGLGHPSTVIFPQAAPLKAVSATRELARKMGVGVAGSD